jgi:hypothetical protein
MRSNPLRPPSGFWCFSGALIALLVAAEATVCIAVDQIAYLEFGYQHVTAVETIEMVMFLTIALGLANIVVVAIKGRWICLLGAILWVPLQYLSGGTGGVVREGFVYALGYTYALHHGCSGQNFSSALPAFTECYAKDEGPFLTRIFYDPTNETNKPAGERSEAWLKTLSDQGLRAEIETCGPYAKLIYGGVYYLDCQN